jgi:hypothetical protein
VSSIFIAWDYPATPFDIRLPPWSGPYKLATEATASRRIRADCIACIELDIGAEVGVPRPLGETWIGGTWEKNTRCTSKKSPTLLPNNIAWASGANRETAPHS